MDANQLAISVQNDQMNLIDQEYSDEIIPTVIENWDEIQTDFIIGKGNYCKKKKCIIANCVRLGRSIFEFCRAFGQEQ